MYVNGNQQSILLGLKSKIIQLESIYSLLSILHYKEEVNEQKLVGLESECNVSEWGDMSIRGLVSVS